MQFSCKGIIKEKWGEVLEDDLVKSLNDKNERLTYILMPAIHIIYSY